MKCQPNEIRVILFDVGGVLVELSGLAMLLSWLGHRVTAEQVRTFWLTSPIVRSFETGKMQPAAFAEQMISELSLQVGSEEFLTELYIRSQRILPGAVELVRRVPRYYVRATLCNTNALQWQSLIEQRDLIGAFDYHFASHLTGKIKPDEEAFQHVLTTLGCEGPVPGRTLGKPWIWICLSCQQASSRHYYSHYSRKICLAPAHWRRRAWKMKNYNPPTLSLSCEIERRSPWYAVCPGLGRIKVPRGT